MHNEPTDSLLVDEWRKAELLREALELTQDPFLTPTDLTLEDYCLAAQCGKGAGTARLNKLVDMGTWATGMRHRPSDGKLVRAWWKLSVE